MLCTIATLAQGQVQTWRVQADSGDVKAMLELAEAYRFGMGAEKNEDSADYFLQHAADTGHPDAEFLLGVQKLTNIYDAGTYAEGLALVKKAAGKDHTAALMRLSEVYSDRNTGTESDKYYNPAKAYTYAEAAAALGDKYGMVFCAEARLAGRGTSQNDSIGVAFMRRAAEEKRFTAAQLRMGDLYWDGTVTGSCAPFAALAWYHKVEARKRANVQQRTTADLGIHQVDQFLKKVQNTMFDAGGMLPTGMYTYRLRQ